MPFFYTAPAQLPWSYGCGGAALYGWGEAPDFSVASFQGSWAVIAGLAMIAIATLGMRGEAKRSKRLI